MNKKVGQFIGNMTKRLLNALRINQKKIFLVFLIITAFSCFVRFWNFEELVNFHLDPPFYLHEVKDMLDSGKTRLVGPIITSKEVIGRRFFTGPLLYYVLAVLGMLTNWNVVIMTAFFTFLWIVALALMFFWLKRRFGDWIALSIYALFSFLPIFIPISRSMWNPHFIPLFGVLFLWFLDIRKKKNFYYFLSGLFFGLSLNAHYSTILWIPIILLVVVQEIRHRDFSFRPWLLFLFAVVLAEFPIILFELRHNFYNLRTIIFHLRYGGASAGYTFALAYYYLFPVVPVLGFSIAALVYKVRKTTFFRSIILSFFLISLLFLKYDLGSTNQKYIYPKGWTLSRQKKVVEIIKNDNEERFEVAETINSDTRALEIRWWLRMSGIDVMDVDEYDVAPILYLVAPGHRSPEKETVWEVRSMQPFEIEFQKDMGEDLFLYKLVRILSK